MIDKKLTSKTDQKRVKRTGRPVRNKPIGWLASVVAKNSAKTATVEVIRQKIHPIYKKRWKIKKRFLIHDPQDSAKVGQIVRVVVSRPISKRKHFVIKLSHDSKKN